MEELVLSVRSVPFWFCSFQGDKKTIEGDQNIASNGTVLGLTFSETKYPYFFHE